MGWGEQGRVSFYYGVAHGQHYVRSDGQSGIETGVTESPSGMERGVF